MNIREVENLFTVVEAAVISSNSTYKHSYDKGIHVIRRIKEAGYRVTKIRYRTTDQKPTSE